MCDQGWGRFQICTRIRRRSPKLRASSSIFRNKWKLSSRDSDQIRLDSIKPNHNLKSLSNVPRTKFGRIRIYEFRMFCNNCRRTSNLRHTTHTYVFSTKRSEKLHFLDVSSCSSWSCDDIGFVGMDFDIDYKHSWQIHFVGMWMMCMVHLRTNYSYVSCAFQETVKLPFVWLILHST